MSRYKAASIHLGISAAIAAATLLVMLAVWYPGPLFGAVGGAGLVLILAGVDVALGPLITLVVFDPAKKSLKLDLTVVALLQLAAFAYGAGIIFQARPAYVAFVVDRFELVRAVDLDPEDMKNAQLEEYKALALLRPRVIAVERPANLDEKVKTLQLALQGKDIQLLPQYYRPYDTQRSLVRRAAMPIEKLRKLNPAASGEIDRAVRETGRSEAQLGFLPLKARSRDLAVVIDKDSGEIVDYWPYRPWEA